MASKNILTNPDIDYGSQEDVKIKNSTSTTTKKPTTQYCPEGQTYLGMVNGKPKCLAPTPRYRNKDKQTAYEISKGIQQPTPSIETPTNVDSSIGVAVGDMTTNAPSTNLLKKYWWVLALAGVGYIILGKK